MAVKNLVITRETIEISESQRKIESFALASIARTLIEAQENCDFGSLAFWPPPQTRQGIVCLVLRLKQELLRKESLTSESPGEWLHEEFSGWGAVGDVAASRPREVAAIDVLEFLIALLSDTDGLEVHG